MKTVFIDGSAGTTGLRIYERLSARQDLQLMTLPDEVRKDPEARKQALNSCDVAFLCLPDAAAMEAVSLTVCKKSYRSITYNCINILTIFDRYIYSCCQFLYLFKSKFNLHLL